MASKEETVAAVTEEGACACCAAPPVRLWRAALAEAAGAALLVLLSCLPECTPARSAAAEQPLYRALTAGLVVAVLIQCFDHISGALINPAVTLAAVVVGRVRAGTGVIYVAAQLAGSVAGVGVLYVIAPTPAPANLCLTLPADGLPIYKAVCVEACASGALCAASCAAWDARNRRLLDSWPLRAGLAVAALALAAGELTGASMNPARSLAPALWAATWDHHWVYWAGPAAGALLSSALYARVWPAPAGAPPRPAAPSPPARAAASSDKMHQAV